MRVGVHEWSSWLRIIAASCAGWSMATTTHAEPFALSHGVAELVEWDVPSGCPDGVALQQSLKDVLGEPLDFGRLERVRGSIERRANDWALTLELIEHGRSRTRLITARACADLADAAALAIQLARVDEGAPAAVAAPTSAPPAPLPLAPEPARTELTDTAPVPEQRARSAGVRASILAGATLDLAALSQPTPGLSLAGRLALARLELELYGLALAPVHEDVRAGESVRFSLLAAGPRVCYRALGAGAFVAKPCIALELGRFAADGAGLSQDERSFAEWWLAPSAGIALELAANPWLALEARAELSRPLLRRTYAVNGNEVVYEPPAIGGRLYLGVSLQIP
jgi:hypothetical protein